MSEQEQDAILGRLMREKAEAKRELAAIEAELHRIAEGLRGAASALDVRCNVLSRIDLKLPEPSIPSHIEPHLEMTKINALLDEQGRVFRKYSEAVSGLDRFGV